MSYPTLKFAHPEEIEMLPEIKARVDEKWPQLGIKGGVKKTRKSATKVTT